MLKGSISPSLSVLWWIIILTVLVIHYSSIQIKINFLSGITRRWVNHFDHRIIKITMSDRSSKLIAWFLRIGWRQYSIVSNCNALLGDDIINWYAVRIHILLYLMQSLACVVDIVLMINIEASLFYFFFIFHLHLFHFFLEFLCQLW